MTSVICTGVQKAGTHLLWRAVQLLGVPKHEDQYSSRENSDRFQKRWLRNEAYSVHRHLPYEGKQLILDLAKRPVKFTVIIRHPKNIIVSRGRRAAHIKRNTISPEEAIEKNLGSYELDDNTRPNGSLRPLFDPTKQLSWLGWLDDPDTCVVRFEDLTGSVEEQMEALARLYSYLEVNKVSPEKMINNLVGESPTWSGKNSNWEEHWNEKIEERFTDIGGYEVMDKLGY